MRARIQEHTKRLGLVEHECAENTGGETRKETDQSQCQRPQSALDLSLFHQLVNRGGGTGRPRELDLCLVPSRFPVGEDAAGRTLVTRLGESAAPIERDFRLSGVSCRSRSSNELPRGIAPSSRGSFRRVSETRKEPMRRRLGSSNPISSRSVINVPPHFILCYLLNCSSRRCQ